MGKHELKQRETQVATNNGVGKEMEQTITVDDNCLPSPQELAAYKEIDPRIVDYLINASVKEQDELVGNVLCFSLYRGDGGSCWICSLFG